MFKLRNHQEDSLRAITEMTTTSGRIVIPTGGGKTAVEAYTLRDAVNLNTRSVHLVLAPRIALVNQLINEYRGYIGQNYLAVAFHSGKMDEPDYMKVKWSETSTTNTAVLDAEYARAKRMNKALVVFSTYASVHKLLAYDFDTIIADESQYCVAENHFNTVRDIKATKKLFFTATEKHTAADGRGLNNESVFGPVLYWIAPKALIEAGYIVAPRLHVMSAKAKDGSYTIIDEVIQLATKQIELSAKHSPYMSVTKILFAMAGTNDVKEIADNLDVVKKALPGYTVFTIISNAKYGAMIDGVKTARGDFLKALRECDNAIICHYDILAEGIDIDGITGVALMRNMKHSKLLQTIGRAVRVYKANPAAKTFCWVSVVALNDDEESMNYVATALRMIRDGGFEVNVEDVLFTGNKGAGIGTGEEDDALTEADMNAVAKAYLTEVEHTIEQNIILEAIATFDATDRRAGMSRMRTV
tara:strand:- start:257 stop:1672 length:1416 start_codon:yes stop_codon:yes gene_type:complete